VQSAEVLKATIIMLETAYLRMLSAASAHEIAA